MRLDGTVGTPCLPQRVLLFEVGVHLVPMSEVIGDRPVHFFQAQRRMLLLQRFGRMPLLESCHDRIEHHTTGPNAHHAMLIDPHILSLCVHGALSMREGTNSCSSNSRS